MKTSQHLSEQVRSGVLWNLLGQMTQQVLRVGFSVALARLLSPREFGLMGMVGVFTGFAGVFVNLGLGHAIIQRKNLQPEHLSSALTLSIAVSCILSLAFLFASGLIAALYGEPVLKPMVVVLSFQFLLSATSLVHAAVLRRSMRFKALVFIETVAFVAGSVAAILLAWLGAGVWSLVANSLTYAGFNMVLLWWKSGWRMRLGFDKTAAKDLWSFGIHLTGFSIINYWARNADNYLIGKYVGAAELGAYNRAYQLMLMPITQVTGMISGVLFPAFCQIQDDVVRLRNALLKSHRIIALVTFPLMACLAILAEPFVLVVFGEKWREVIPFLRILSWVGLGQSLDNQHLVYNPLGRPDLTLKVGGISCLILVLSFVAGLPWGAVGIATAYAIAWWGIVFPISWKYPMNLLGLPMWHVVGNLRHSILCTAVMSIVVLIVYLWTKQHWAPVVQLLGAGGAGVVTYFACIYFLNHDALRELKRILFGVR